MENFT
jgi:hypothetical protein